MTQRFVIQNQWLTTVLAPQATIVHKEAEQERTYLQMPLNFYRVPIEHWADRYPYVTTLELSAISAGAQSIPSLKAFTGLKRVELTAMYVGEWNDLPESLEGIHMVGGGTLPPLRAPCHSQQHRPLQTLWLSEWNTPTIQWPSSTRVQPSSSSTTSSLPPPYTRLLIHMRDTVRLETPAMVEALTMASHTFLLIQEADDAAHLCWPTETPARLQPTLKFLLLASASATAFLMYRCYMDGRIDLPRSLQCIWLRFKSFGPTDIDATILIQYITRFLAVLQKHPPKVVYFQYDRDLMPLVADATRAYALANVSKIMHVPSDRPFRSKDIQRTDWHWATRIPHDQYWELPCDHIFIMKYARIPPITWEDE